MDFSKILDEWENRGDRKAREGYDKDEAATTRPLPSRAEMERTPTGDELDLHGQLQDEAIASLRYFLRESRLGGIRKVLVIHGKGLHSENRKGVLKEAVHQVLVKDKNVAAWGEAGRKDGGRGASWVWLKGN
jgi:DNA-nicking Smr family endonuclease